MLAGKVVVVIGGGTGIGAATALAFAKAGARVFIGGRRAEQLAKLAEQSSATHPIHLRGVDVSRRDDVLDYFNWVLSLAGRIDIFVNAAGINVKDRAMAVLSPEQWDNVVNINANGAYNCFLAVLPTMRKQKDGVIFNISSVAGKRAIALGGVAYSASKFAMTALGTCISNEVNKEGIRVVNVYPGEVNTPILDHRPTPVTEEHRQRILQPEDVANVLTSLAALPANVHVPEIVIKPLSQEWY
jgi:NADP-dependent 3-hydroxy acid dehydrogenase YdfG